MTTSGRPTGQRDASTSAYESLTVMTWLGGLGPAALRPTQEPARRPTHARHVPGVEVDVAGVVDDRHAVALAHGQGDRDAHERHPVDEVAARRHLPGVLAVRPDLERDREPAIDAPSSRARAAGPGSRSRPASP